MSRLGKIPVTLSKGVIVRLQDEIVHVKGPKGELSQQVKPGIGITIEGDKLFVTFDEKSDLPKATHGLYRSLIGNMVEGVSKGFTKKLTLIGVGYRANVQGNLIDLQIGSSHPVQISIPSGVQVVIEKGTQVTITGINAQVVGEFAAKVRSHKKPEPYKGKGIRYENEIVKKKAGKAAKGKTA